MKKYKICPKCHKKYALGYAGIGSGCDSCEGVIREPDGAAWEPGEEYQIRISVYDGSITKVMRADALGHGR